MTQMTRWNRRVLDRIDRNVVRNVIVVGCAAAFVAAFVGLLTTYLVNVPKNDDMPVVLGFLSQWSEAEPHDKFTLLFNLHNEHRIVLPRLVFLLEEGTFGHVDFVNINLYSNLGWLLCAIVLGALAWCRYGVYAFLAIGLLLAPQALKLHTYATAGLQAYWVALFGVCYFAMLGCRGQLRWLSLPLYVLAVFTSANGLFLPLIALPLLVLYSRERILPLITAASLVVMLLLYVALPGEMPNRAPGLLTVPGYTLVFFFGLVGSGTSFIPIFDSEAASVALGIALLLAGAPLLWAAFRRGDIALVGIALFSLLSLGLVANGRAPIYELDVVFDGRYRLWSILYGTILIIFTVWQFVPRSKPAWLAPHVARSAIMLVASAGTTFAVYSSSTPIMKRQINGLTAICRWIDDPANNPSTTRPGEFTAWLRDAVNLGIYAPECPGGRTSPSP